MIAPIKSVNKRIAQISLFLICGVNTGLSFADALFDSAFEVANQTLLKDHELPHVYYLVPPPPSIALNDDQSPTVFLSLTHYIGNELRDDAGNTRVNWSLLVELERKHISQVQRSRIISLLQHSSGANRDIILRDMPISSVPTNVIYQPIDTPELAIKLASANVVAGEQTSLTRYQDAYWTRRYLSFALSPNDGITMRAAFEAGGSIMSVSTHYQALGISLDESDPIAPIYRRTKKVVAQSAIQVQVNRDTHPEYLRVVDLNSISPPGYVGLTLLCYDFNDDQTTVTLSLKKVELEAEGVSGRTIKISLQFQKDADGTSQQFAKFPYAVRVDRPFRYRTRSYDLIGKLTTSEWKNIKNWVIPLDVTSYPGDQQNEGDVNNQFPKVGEHNRETVL